MAREFGRPQRVGEQIQRELAMLMQRELKDPRVGMATVSAVEVSRDLAYATVFVTFLGKDDPKEIKAAVDALQHASGFLRSQLGKIIRMRLTPHLTFKYDESLVRGRELSTLIEQARARDSDEIDHSDDNLKD
ncbi:MAG: ribosome-binding factor A [Gammaproteobacteria bacterium]|nr:MAG: ribosome-binding factor A [Gammaproteobacteria bacterium]